jgi:hypothetical protein
MAHSYLASAIDAAFRRDPAPDYVLVLQRHRTTWHWTLCRRRNGGSFGSTIAGVSRKHAITVALGGRRGILRPDGTRGSSRVAVLDCTTNTPKDLGILATDPFGVAWT